ncbi:unnamed protein product [Danaus chrysippus]|uniref:(African queen) hypothetical protein n=1 Tax=Danaus chrysippus TaxID=151541 RepID=A0A8J2RC99_9NEOP|nr:unnamed protein product [Danaus chrysippus]
MRRLEQSAKHGLGTSNEQRATTSTNEQRRARTSDEQGNMSYVVGMQINMQWYFKTKPRPPAESMTAFRLETRFLLAAALTWTRRCQLGSANSENYGYESRQLIINYSIVRQNLSSWCVFEN